MANLSIQNLCKTYPGEIRAVVDFNLEIKDGEFVVLVGPSGCGKSTVLRMIAGLEEITSGDIHIGDKLVNHIQPKNRDIAMVFQNYALYPHMTVYDNMAFGLTMRRVPKKEIRSQVESIAEQLEITDLLRRKPGALSGGQRQRVALGRAMVRNPAVFLLDEPLSNLDAKLRATMRTEISQLHKQLEGTFIYVTHDQTEAMTMGDRIVVMKDGYLQQADTPLQLYQSPVNLFVAGFIGSPQMNFLTVVVKEDTKRDFLLLGENRIYLPDAWHLDPYYDKEVVLGIRPEHFALTQDSAGIPTRVTLCELLGAESYLYLDVGQHKIVARIPPCTLSPGDAVSVAPDVNQIHLFDRDTELAIPKHSLAGTPLVPNQVLVEQPA